MIWKRGELEKLPIRDGTVDVALLSQALHHAADPARAVQEAVRILAPGGRVLVLDLREHGETWVRERLGDRWPGFSDDAPAAAAGRRRPRRREDHDRGAADGRSVHRAHRVGRQGTQKEKLSMFETLRTLLDRRILILDGAMGTMIQRYKLTEADFRGERFANHPRDLEGTATCSSSRGPTSSARSITSISPPAPTSSRRTRSAGPRSRRPTTRSRTRSTTSTSKARGSRERPPTSGTRRRPIGRASSPAPWARPTARCRSRPTSTTRPTAPPRSTRCARPTSSRSRGLLDGGSDIILLETIFDTLSAKSALVAIENVFEERGVRLPLMISVTVADRSGRTLSGQTIDAFYVSIRHARPFSVGINCALGARDMRPYLAELARIAECYVSSYPERRAAECVRRVRRAAGGDRRAPARLRDERLRQHPRRLLRHDAGAHHRHRGGGGRRRAAAAAVADRG